MSFTIEQIFNQALGQVLRKTTVRWQRRGAITLDRADRPYLQIRDSRALPIVIESSFGELAATCGRVMKEQGEPIKTVIAVRIPAFFRGVSLKEMVQTLRNGCPIGYAVYHLGDRWPVEGFLSGSVYDLATLVPVAALRKEDIERLTEVVANRLKHVATLLSEALPDPTQDLLTQQVDQRSPLTGLRTITVLWLMQSFLRKQQGTDREVIHTGLRLHHEHPVLSTQEAARRAHPLVSAQALEQINKAREQIESANLGPYVNVGAELFPLLSEDRKEAAAYYTQPATAELLAHLTIRYEQLPPKEWADAQLLARKRLADLTGGTGTLLRAGYQRLLSFHERAGGTRKSSDAFHRAAMEYGLVGVDVSPIAAHLTRSSLAALGTSEYAQSQIGWVDVGGPQGYTGSLEYFGDNHTEDLFETTDLMVSVPDQHLEWILMNPPYSRTRGGQRAFDIAGLDDKERKRCQKRWKALVKFEA